MFLFPHFPLRPFAPWLQGPPQGPQRTAIFTVLLECRVGGAVPQCRHGCSFSTSIPCLKQCHIMHFEAFAYVGKA